MQMCASDPPGLADKIRTLLSDPANLPYKANIILNTARLSLDISAVSNENDEHIGFVVEWNDVTAEFMNRAILSWITPFWYRLLLGCKII